MNTPSAILSLVGISLAANLSLSASLYAADDFGRYDQQQESSAKYEQQANKRLIDIVQSSISNGGSLSKMLLDDVRQGYLQPNRTIKPDQSNYTPLNAALVLDPEISLDTIKGFVAEGATLQASPYLWSAVSQLEPDNYEDTLHYLLNAGVDFNVAFQEQTPVERALYHGNIDVVRWLEQRGFRLKDEIKIGTVENGELTFSTMSLLDFFKLSSNVNADVMDYLAER